MEEFTRMKNKDVCKALHLRTTAELGYVIHSGQLGEIGTAIPPHSNGVNNEKWKVIVYRECFEAWQERNAK